MAQEFTVFVSVPGTDRPWLKTFTHPAIVGRSDDCDIPLAHPVVSRQHAEVRRAPDGDLIVRDLGSTNGTISGNEVLRGHEIRAPEQISLQIGPYSIVVSTEARSDASTLAVPIVNDAPTVALNADLSAREREVLALIAGGRTNAEIAIALGITDHTVVSHVRHIFDKSGVANRAEAAAYAVRNGLAP